MSANNPGWRMPLVLMSAVFISCWLGHPAIVRTAEPDHDSARGVLRIQPNDSLTRKNLEVLMSQAPTGRELVARIERLQDVVLILRAHPLLLRQEQLLGRVRIWGAKRQLVGTLATPARPPRRAPTARTLAHSDASAV